MKVGAIVRNLDYVGRITLPVEIRNKFDIKHGDDIEIGVDGDKIILFKASDIQKSLIEPENNSSSFND